MIAKMALRKYQKKMKDETRRVFHVSSDRATPLGSGTPSAAA